MTNFRRWRRKKVGRRGRQIPAVAVTKMATPWFCVFQTKTTRPAIKKCKRYRHDDDSAVKCLRHDFFTYTRSRASRTVGRRPFQFWGCLSVWDWVELHILIQNSSLFNIVFIILKIRVIGRVGWLFFFSPRRPSKALESLPRPHVKSKTIVPKVWPALH